MILSYMILLEIISFLLFFFLTKGYNLTKNSVDSIDKMILYYHRLIETFKHTFAKRSYLGDSTFVNVTEVIQTQIT